MRKFVHRAGTYLGGVQRCDRCEHILVDYRSCYYVTDSGPPPRGFAEGTLVVRDGNQLYVRDLPLAVDESLCGWVLL